MGIGALGTIRTNRFPGLLVPTDAEMKKIGRGSMIEKGTEVDGVEVRVVKWFDNRGVSLASTFDSAQPISTVKRYDKKTKSKVDISCPRAVLTYNKFMGGVDLLDGLVSYYRINIRSKKYYHKLIFHFVDVALVNSWLLYRRDCDMQNFPKKTISDLLQFKTDVSAALCSQGKDPTEKKRGRPSSYNVEEMHEKKKMRGPAKPIPNFSVRRDGIAHWPAIVDARQRCKFPGCTGITTVKCSKCSVHLCLTRKKNCFVDFHT